MGRIRNQMISVRDLLRKMRSHAVISVLSAVGLATIGCGFVVFSAIGGLDTATYETEVIEGDQVTVRYGDDEGTNKMSGMLQRVHEAVEEVHRQASANYIAVEEVDHSLSDAWRRAQDALENASAKIDGLDAHIAGYGQEFTGMNERIAGVSEGISGVRDGIAGVSEGITGVRDGIAGVNDGIAGVSEGITGVRDGIAGVNDGIAGVSEGITGVRDGIASVNDGIAGVNDGIQEMTGSLSGVSEELSGVGDSIAGMQQDLTGVGDSIAHVTEGIVGVSGGLADANEGIAGVSEGIAGVSEGISGVSEEIAQVSGNLTGVTKDVQSVQEKLLAFGESVSGSFHSSDEKLDLLLEQLALSNQNIISLQNQLAETRQEIDTLKTMVTNVGANQNTINSTITESEQKRDADYKALKSMIDTNAQNIAIVSNRVPFALGIDSEGEYGYVKEGADTVIPFRRPGQRTGEIVNVAHRHAEKSGCYREVPGTTQIVEKTCGQGMKVEQYPNCVKCHQGPNYCNANPVCADGGPHVMGETLYSCSRCGYKAFGVSGSCPGIISETVPEYVLDCTHTTCGAMYIENSVTKTGRRECPLTLVCSPEGAGMRVEAYAWRAEERGVISGAADNATITAAHNGLYICTVTVRDDRSGLTYETEVVYRVRNLIK